MKRKKSKRFTVGNACGEWPIWDHLGKGRCIAVGRSQRDAVYIVRRLNAKQGK